MGKQFVNGKWLKSHHADVLMDYVFFIAPPPFYEGTLADFEQTLDNCWFWRVVLLFLLQWELARISCSSTEGAMMG